MRERISILMLIITFLCPFSFSPIKKNRHRFKVFKFCIHLLQIKLYCVKENNDADIYFTFFFPFLLSSISHSMSNIFKELMHLGF